MACDNCTNGWIAVTRRNGATGTHRCPCSVVAPPTMDTTPVTPADLMRAVVRMAALIPFFADTDLARDLVIGELSRFVSTRQQIEWLTINAIAKFNRLTVANLRGLFCTEFQPRDGIVAACTDEDGKPLPGMTQWDQEAIAERQFVQQEIAERESQVAQITATAASSPQLLGPGDSPSDPLPPEVRNAISGRRLLRPTTEDWRAARAFEERINPRAPATEELPDLSGSPESRRQPVAVGKAVQVAPQKPPTREDQRALEREPWYQEFIRISGRTG